MPTNKELEKQLKELRKIVEENAEKHVDIEEKTKWSDSKGAIALQVILAVAAVAIAWGQFKVANTQTDLSKSQNEIAKRQAEMQGFEIIREV